MYDEETGLYYLKSRYYDPETARFLNEDTYKGNVGDPLSLNLYAYCHYNPLRYFDPLGHAVVYVSGIGYYDDTTWKALTGPDFTKAPGDTGSVYNYADGPGSRPAGSVTPVVRAPIIKTIQEPPKVINTIPAPPPPTPTQNPQNPQTSSPTASAPNSNNTPAAIPPTGATNNSSNGYTGNNSTGVSDNKPTNTTSTPAVTVVIPEQLNTLVLNNLFLMNPNILKDPVPTLTDNFPSNKKALEEAIKFMLEKQKQNTQISWDDIRAIVPTNNRLDNALADYVFNHPDEAAMAFGIVYYGLSEAEKREYDAVIVQHWDEKTKKITYTVNDILIANIDNPTQVTRSGIHPNAIARIHTHLIEYANGDKPLPAGVNVKGDNIGFSEPDINVYKKNIDTYLYFYLVESDRNVYEITQYDHNGYLVPIGNIDIYPK